MDIGCNFSKNTSTVLKRKKLTNSKRKNGPTLVSGGEPDVNLLTGRLDKHVDTSGGSNKNLNLTLEL